MVTWVKRSGLVLAAGLLVALARPTRLPLLGGCRLLL